MKLALATVALLFARCGAVVITMVLADSQIFEVDVPDGPRAFGAFVRAAPAAPEGETGSE